MATDETRAATLQRAGLSTESELTAAQARRLDRLADDDLPESMAGGKLAAAIMQGKGMSEAKGRDSAARNILEAALTILKRAKQPLTRKQIEERLAKQGLEGKPGTTWRTSDVVCVAQAEGREVKGYRFTRPERGRYSVEEVQ